MEALTYNPDQREYWKERFSASDFNAMLEVQDYLKQGMTPFVLIAVNEYIEKLANKDRHALLSHLEILLAHIIKWYEQPDKRTLSWLDTVENSQEMIKEIQLEHLSLNDRFLQDNWERVLKKATKRAFGEMNKDHRKVSVPTFTMDEVLNKEYSAYDIPSYFKNFD